MIIYVLMILWIPIIYLFYSLNHKEEIKLADYNLTQGRINKIPMVYCILLFGFFIFWIGMRSYIADTAMDIVYFERIPSDFSTAWSQINWNGKSPGYDIINAFFKCFISRDYQHWLMANAIICGVCMVVGLRRYSIDFFMSAYLFMTLLIFFWIINGMRQFTCVAVFFAFNHWIEEKKYFRLLILIVFLCTIHITALLCIPLIIVARGKPWTGSTFVLIIAIVLICLFSSYFFRGVESIFGGESYQGYTDQFADDDGVNLLRVLFTTVFPAMAFIKRKKLESYYDLYPFLPICINFSMVTVGLFFIGMFTSGILVGRLPIYSEVFNMILIPFLLKLGFSKEEQRIVTPIMIIVLFIYFWLKTPHSYNSSFLNIHIQDSFM